MDNVKVDVQDPLTDVNLGTTEDPLLIYVSELLDEVFKAEVINV